LPGRGDLYGRTNRTRGLERGGFKCGSRCRRGAMVWGCQRGKLSEVINRSPFNREERSVVGAGRGIQGKEK